MLHPIIFFSFFFFNDTATTEIYTLSLHDALPIFLLLAEMLHHPNLVRPRGAGRAGPFAYHTRPFVHGDRKSTRLNSSHSQISYAVFCLKKKKKVLSQLSTFNSMTHCDSTIMLAAY